MADGSIAFEGVWKKFRRGERHDSLRDLIPALARAVTRRREPATELKRQEFWALRDVSFEVKPGEALGVIGPNGAGKSTMLKVMIRLLRPDHGRSTVKGRVGSLIEISGSLHPDLTGRENIYLQGSVMGMRRAEITRKFDEIVEFSELSEFIDTPVKRYSSGMNARLGFSVAAHLETDVLIIDEVLSVGDSAFQRKAFDRMKSMVKSGVPAVVVSHQLERIAALCDTAILLERGTVVFRGAAPECIAAYARQQAAGAPAGEDTGDPDADVRIESLALAGPQPVPSGGRVAIVILGEAPPMSQGLSRSLGIRVRSLQTGDLVFATGTNSQSVELPIGGFELTIELQLNVPPGIYAIESTVGTGQRKRGPRSGPAALVHVGDGPVFWGQVQMNSVMRVAPRRLAESNPR